MFPVLYEIKPQVSELISTTQNLELLFDDKIDIASAEHVLVNMNTGKEFTGYSLETNDDKDSISIKLNDGCKYEQLTTYKFTINNLKTLNSPIETLTYPIVIKFETRQEAKEQTVPTTPVQIPSINITNSYPRYKDYLTPKSIKLKFDVVPDEVRFDFYKVNDKMDKDFFEDSDYLIKNENFVITPTSTIVSYDISNIKLEENKDYEIAVYYSLGDKQYEEKIPFTSSYSKMYIDSKQLNDSNAFKFMTNGMTPQEIDSVINQNSLAVDELIKDNADITIESTSSYVPKIVFDYVKYKSQYDLLFNQIIYISSNATMQQLKDLVIQYNQNLGDLLDLADKLKLRYKGLEPELTGKSKFTKTSLTFVRGANVDAEYDFMSRQFMGWDGTKSW